MKDEDPRKAAFEPFMPFSADLSVQPFEVRFRLPRAGAPGLFDLPLDDVPRVIDSVASFKQPCRFTLEAAPPFSDGYLVEALAYSLRRGVTPIVSFRGEPSEADLALVSGHGVREVEFTADAVDDAFLRTLLRLAEGKFRAGLRYALGGRNVTRLGLAVEAACEYGVRRFTALFPVDRNEAGAFSATDAEDVFNFLYAVLVSTDVFIDTERAPHFRRFILERLIEERRSFGRPPVRKIYMPGLHLAMQDTAPLLRAPEWLKSDPAMKTHGICAGDGMLYVGCDGRIHPAECFPADAGNVKTNDLLEVYRDSTLFRDLRSRRQVKGKCRGCAYLNVCGGCRERAYHFGGDAYLEEPLCAFSFQSRMKRY